MPQRRLSPGLRISGLALLVVSLLADLIPGNMSPGFGFVQLTGLFAGALQVLLGTLLSPTTRRRLGRPVVGGLSALLGFALLACAGVYLMSRERGATFIHDGTTGPAEVWTVVRRAGVTGAGICRCAPQKVAQIALPDGFQTELSIYEKGEGGVRPGLLLVHGNTWLGQRLSTYRLLATLLAERGYTVATFDFPGFGRADDPFGRGPAAVATAYDRDAQIDHVIEYLINNSTVDSDNLFGFGHSGGVDHALRAGHRNPRLSAVVAMVSPSTPLSSREAGLNRAEYFRRRFASQYELVYRRRVPKWFTWELTGRAARQALDPWEYYVEEGHKPLLVLLGEHDEPAGHGTIRSIYSQLAEPKTLVLIGGSDHYGNSAQSTGFTVYDRGVGRQLVGEVASWLESHRRKRGQEMGAAEATLENSNSRG